MKKTPRENADIIHAYADGHDVEFHMNNTNYEYYIIWTPDCNIHVGDPRYKWRIYNPEDMYP
jgi:hypothetical protein